MKRILPISLLVICCFSCGGKKAKVYKGDNMYKIYQEILVDNKIQLAKTYECYVTDGKVDSINPKLSVLQEFDKRGNEIRSERYYDSGTSKFFTTYNDSNQKVTSRYESFGGFNQTSTFITKNGKHAETISTDDDGKEVGHSYTKYNEKGQAIEYISKGLSDYSNYRTVYTFDDKDRVLTSQEYDSTGAITIETKYTYVNDTLLQMTTKYFKELSESFITATFNENKQEKVMEYITNQQTKEGFKMVYEYHKNGLKKAIWHYHLPDGKVTRYEWFKYTQHK